MTGSIPHHRKTAVFAVAAACFVFAAIPALAIGESDTIETCRKGLIYDSTQFDCVELKNASISDRNRALYAYALAKEGRFEETLLILDTMVDSNTPEALNYRGYATRKLGRTDEGIGYYLKSISIAPQYASPREYLGEAYVTIGRLDLAREQLKAIEGICGTQCEEYVDLAEAIEKAPKG